MEEPSSTEPPERIDLPIFDPLFKSNPYPFYERLRRAGRTIVPVRLPTGVEAWLVIGHAAARQLLNDPRLSKQEQRDRSPHRGSSDESGRNRRHSVFDHLLTMDPPRHTRLRSIAAREFSTARVNQLRPRIDAVAAGLLDALDGCDEVDLIDAFAVPFPLKVICELLGLPPEDEPRMRDWSAQLLEADLEAPERVPLIAEQLHQYFSSLALIKRASPDTLLFSALVAAVDGGELSTDELMAMGFLLLLAGHETTVNLIGNGMVALLHDRAAWNDLCAGHSSAASIVEEVLRYDSPLEVATPRFATSEIVIENVRIQAGEMVFVGLGAANRDVARFDRPNVLDIDRADSREHLAFGHGIHYCLGAPLARVEGEIAFTALSRRFPHVEPGVPFGALRWKPGLIMRGLERLPVRLRGAQRRETAP